MSRPLNAMFTMFLLRGWPIGYDVWWEVTSFETYTVVVAWATKNVPPARYRMTLIDPGSDVVFIHHPTGRPVDIKIKRLSVPSDVHKTLSVLFVSLMTVTYNCPGCGRRNAAIGVETFSCGCTRCDTHYMEDGIKHGYRVSFQLRNNRMTTL